ncbi:hypothetical protein AVEN_30904-1 [Araneus ventricosus]|uniref:Uncharacterized protein n=1 Tax=Araneus ventricosus TaxID=182803 RepID=A0A4Y2WFV0_ARAVE|nr:hypothetical protein AVEN_30904-1 [Araneus ventricosus]
MLKALFVRDVAIQYSMYGKKGKKPFVSLVEICAIMFGVASVKFPHMNQDDISERLSRALALLKLGDQDKPWAPHKVCRRCEKDLRLWFKGKKNSFLFGIPMMWCEQQNHTTNFYFCLVDVRGFNTKNKKNIFYPNLSSAIRPAPHTSEIPFPHPSSSLNDIRSDSEVGGTLPQQDKLYPE